VTAGVGEAASSGPALDEGWSGQVAEWFISARSDPGDPVARAAYEALQRQSDRLFRRLTDDAAPHVRVVFTRCRSPYESDEEMIAAVRRTGVLEVATAADSGRPHPLLGSECGGPYDRFRAVHDLVGHVQTGCGFDRHGEFAAWLAQERFYGGLARAALGTELHGEHSVCWTTGAFADHKATVLPRCVLDRARAGLSARRAGTGPREPRIGDGRRSGTRNGSTSQNF
jgi:hypothetical protein